MTEKQTEQKGIKVAFPDAVKAGVYCNNMNVIHTSEEFIMDFMVVAPPAGAITARVIMSPGHMKRTIKALQLNMQKYEKKFGIIKEAPEPPAAKGKLGFQV